MRPLRYPERFVPLFAVLQPGCRLDDASRIESGHRETYGRREGFLIAGRVLLERARSGSGLELDLLVYPALFNLRHYLELSLKEIVADARVALALPAPDPKKLDHRIDALWTEARQLLQGIAQGEFPHDEADVVEQQIHEFASHDPDGTGFRYSTTRKGGESLPGLMHLDLAKVQNVMERMSNFLSCSLSVAADARQYVLDRQSEMRG